MEKKKNINIFSGFPHIERGSNFFYTIDAYSSLGQVKVIRALDNDTQ